MKGTALFVFFFLAILCSALSVTNYLNITILNNDNILDGFKGNRSGFLDVEDESVVISTFEQYGDPIYKANALTVQDSPVKIQILNSNSKEHSIPTLNIANTGTSDVNIKFNTNDPNGLIETGKIDITSGDNGISDVNFNTGIANLRFNDSGNVFATGMFNFAPYLDNVVTVPTTNDGWFRYSVTTNTTYLIPRNIYDGGTSNNNTNCWFYLPTVEGVTPGDHINFVFTGIASIVNDGNRKITKWGPPGAIAQNSFIDNWGPGIKRMNNLPSDTSRMGIQRNTSSNNILTGNFSYNDLNNSDTNNTPSGTLVQFNALNTNPITWAVELDTVQPMCNFYFENIWSPGGTTNHQI